MARKRLNSSPTMAEAFDSFLFSKSAQGVTDKTLKSYKGHFNSISNYFDTSIKLKSLKKEDVYTRQEINAHPVPHNASAYC